MTEDDVHKALTLVGLAYRAKKVSWGEIAAKDAVVSGRAKIVLLTLDAGAKLADEFAYLSEKHGSRLLRIGERESLGRALGRKIVSVATIDDEGFAGAFAKYEKLCKEN